MHDAAIEDGIRVKFKSLQSVMDERVRRRWAAKATALGRGGIATVARATGLARNTIRAGIRELGQQGQVDNETGSRIRRPSGGRKSVTQLDPELMKALEKLVDPVTRGDPESPLRWTCKSTARLAK